MRPFWVLFWGMTFNAIAASSIPSRVIAVFRNNPYGNINNSGGNSINNQLPPGYDPPPNPS